MSNLPLNQTSFSCWNRVFDKNLTTLIVDISFLWRRRINKLVLVAVILALARLIIRSHVINTVITFNLHVHRLSLK